MRRDESLSSTHISFTGEQRDGERRGEERRGEGGMLYFQFDLDKMVHGM